VPDCVIRLTPRKLRIDSQDYYYVGSVESGHWYRIVSIKEERGHVWKDFITEPREPTWIRVVIAAGSAGFEEVVSVIWYTKPIRIVGLPDYWPSQTVEEVRRQTYVLAIEERGAILFTAACSLEMPKPKDCNGLGSSMAVISLALRYWRLERDFLVDRDFWKEAALLAAR